MTLLNVPAESWVAGRYYTMTSACGFVLVYGYNCVSNILRGTGDSRRPLVFVAIASGMNIVLDLLFVIGFHWGAFGAVLPLGIMGFWIGSALAGVVSVAICGIYYYSGRWKTRRLIT